ncbi:MAG: hypothetical protein ISR85_06155 [Kiritimatiellales bacterium]|nr:hypothetical protein [Kiritimatiellota bacterium]MBL7012492.1 hypothetical protein [Kiritimatiellales bacterium]
MSEYTIRFEIRRARNGLILKVEESLDDERPPEIICQERYDDEVDGFAEFLRYLNDEFGPSTSRHSPKRIYIKVEPGDKFEDEGEAGGKLGPI